jgi:hypothetical protein
MIDFEAELDRLAADLAVLDVACGAGTRVNWRLEALATIRALDQVKSHARIVQKNNRHSSGCGPMVVAEHSAEALSALNRMMG